MTTRDATVVNPLGLHARPVNGKRIMGVMMLAAECGSVLIFKADGPDEEKAVEALAALVATGFGEQ